MNLIRQHRLAWFGLGVLVIASVLGVSMFAFVWSDVRTRAIDAILERTLGEVRAFDTTLAGTGVALDSTQALFEVAAPITRAHSSYGGADVRVLVNWPSPQASVILADVSGLAFRGHLRGAFV